MVADSSAGEPSSRNLIIVIPTRLTLQIMTKIAFNHSFCHKMASRSHPVSWTSRQRSLPSRHWTPNCQLQQVLQLQPQTYVYISFLACKIKTKNLLSKSMNSLALFLGFGTTLLLKEPFTRFTATGQHSLNRYSRLHFNF